MGQLEFDLRLDYERSLKENLIAVASVRRRTDAERPGGQRAPA